MATVSILPISDSNGETHYQAIAGKLSSTGKTAGQALDGLTAQLEETEPGSLLVLQSFQPDSFFGAKQQAQLSTLMEQWRSARDEGKELSSSQQQELDNLVETELKAATARAKTLFGTIGV